MANMNSHPFQPGEQHPMFINHMECPIPILANAVYYPNWRVYDKQPPSSLNTDHISHIFYAFAWPNADGTISLSDEYADKEISVDGTRGCIRALMMLRADEPTLKLVLSLGGGGKGSDHFASIASAPRSRQVFAANVRETVDCYGFNGIDIDWEHPATPEQGADYIELIACIRSFLPSPIYTLTSALPAGEWALRNIDMGKASTYLDYINLMTYDFAGPWVNRTGHQSQLYTPQYPHSDAATTSCDSAVSYVCSKGVPPSKILLGIPTYGRSFLRANGVGQQYEGTAGNEGTFDYKDLPRPGAQELVDTSVGAAYCVGGDGGFVTYDNPQTVKMKAGYVRTARLGGLFYWTGTGDAKGSRSLVQIGHNALYEN